MLEKFPIGGVMVVAIVVLVLAGCGSGDQACMPEVIGQWAATGPAREYAGDELFIYINGGAEIYHEYGFENVAVHHYQREQDCLTVEIYTMTGDAYGVYTFSRSASGRAVDLGNGGTAAEYYVHLWSGPSLAVVTADTDFADRAEQVIEIAGVVARCLPDGGIEPDLMSRLPGEGRVEGSETYLRGSIALHNVARVVAPLFAGFDEGAVALSESVGGNKAQVVVMSWNDEAAAASAFAEAEARASAIEDAAVQRNADHRLELVMAGDRISILRDQELITVTVTEVDETE